MVSQQHVKQTELCFEWKVWRFLYQWFKKQIIQPWKLVPNQVLYGQPKSVPNGKNPIFWLSYPKREEKRTPSDWTATKCDMSMLYIVMYHCPIVEWFIQIFLDQNDVNGNVNVKNKRCQKFHVWIVEYPFSKAKGHFP